MEDFKSLIKEAISSGKTIEEVMKDISAAANEVEKGLELSNRDAYLNDLESTLVININSGEFDIEDAARLTTLVVCDGIEGREIMDVNDIKEFYKLTLGFLKVLPDTWRLYDRILNASPLGDTSKIFSDLFNNKSKEKREKKTPAAADVKMTINSKPVTDEQIIRKFVDWLM